MEEFWQQYSHLTRPNDLPSSINYHLFRDGIAPVWEVRHDNEPAWIIPASIARADRSEEALKPGDLHWLAR